MNKVDNMFLKIISDERFASTFDVAPSKYRSLDEGKRALNPHVKAVAEMVDQLNKKINEAKSDMRIRNKVGPVVFTEADFKPIYNKAVSSLSK